ncbi:MAG: MFS transporter [Acidaminococcaceae bacterium]
MLDAEWTAKKKALLSKRFIVWMPLALAYFVGFFHKNAGALVGESLKIDFAITSAAQLGFLTSIYFYTSAVMQIPSGIIADKFNPKQGIIGAMLFIIGGTVVSGLAPSLTVLYIGRLILSIGCAMIYINLFKIASNWWRTEEMGTISSYTSMAGNAGPLVATVPLAYIINSVGWRGSYYLMAGVVAVAMVLCIIFTKSRPADAGLPSWAEIEAKENGTEVAPIKAKADIKIWESLKQVMTNKQSIFAALACGGMYGSFIAFAGIWAIPYFMQIYGFTKMEAASILFIGQISYIIAGPINGILSDRLRRRKLLFCIYTFVALLGWLLFAFWNGGKPPIWGIYLVIIMIHVGSSPVFMGLSYAREVNPPALTGMAAGVVNVGSYVGAGLMQPLFGMVLERYWDGTIINGARIYSLEAFQVGFFCCAVAIGISWLSTLCMVETRCKNISSTLQKS